MAYVVAEASHAPKQKDGPWAAGYAGAERAISRADLMFCLNPVDAVCTAPLLGGPQVSLKPFIDTAPYQEAAAGRERSRDALARRHSLDGDEPWLLSVAMMRDGDKLDSYCILGRALSGLLDRPWRLLVAGDGPARQQVDDALATLGPRVAWLGVQEADALPGLYAAADAYLWPAVNEAYGMAFLEAQAAGLPVVAGRSGGVPDVVGETGILTPAGDWASFAEAVASPARRRNPPARLRRQGPGAGAEGARPGKGGPHPGPRLAGNPGSPRPMTPLALIRHGPTEWNRLGRIQGQTDVPLDARGREAVAAWTTPPVLEGYRWVASPLSRAVETARILGAEPDLEPSLVEMDWGRWEGLRIENLRAELGRDMADNESRGLDFRPPDGESPRDVQRRIAPWLATVAATGQATVAVTHKGVIRAVLRPRQGLGHDRQAARIS